MSLEIPEEYEHIYHQAIKKWGRSSQMLMAIEECAELQEAISHFFRQRADESDVAEEVADVIIMCWQLSVMVDGVEEEIERKMNRLKNRLNE